MPWLLILIIDAVMSYRCHCGSGVIVDQHDQQNDEKLWRKSFFFVLRLLSFFSNSRGCPNIMTRVIQFIAVCKQSKQTYRQGQTASVCHCTCVCKRSLLIAIPGRCKHGHGIGQNWFAHESSLGEGSSEITINSK